MKEASRDIQSNITAAGNPEKARWLENYIKHNIKSKGVGIPEIRDIVKEASNQYQLTESGISEQTDLLNELMASEYTEDKLAAIIYIQLFWKTGKEQETIHLISDWFDKGYISDWNVCDWLCVKLLTPMADRDIPGFMIELKKWNKDKNLWKARASLVPFAQSKSLEKHKHIIEAFSLELIKRNERFCKTAVGWVLREYSKIDPGFVERFLIENENWTTIEVIKYARKYFSS